MIKEVIVNGRKYVLERDEIELVFNGERRMVEVDREKEWMWIDEITGVVSFVDGISVRPCILYIHKEQLKECKRVSVSQSTLKLKY